MPLSSEAQALFDHAKNALPRWLFVGRQAVQEWLLGFVAVMDPVRSLAQEWLDGIYFDTATGRWLDQHAKDRDTTRRDGEGDTSLRARIRQIEDTVTDPALQRGINTILGVSVTFGTAQTFTTTDPTHGSKIIDIPTGTYLLHELIDYIQARLQVGWTIRVFNARCIFESLDPTTGEPQYFNVDMSASLRTFLGYSTGIPVGVKASFDLNDTCTSDIIVEAIIPGVHGNRITVTVINDGEYLVEDGNAVLIGIDGGVTTNADIEALIATSTMIQVKTASASPGSTVGSGDELPHNLTEGSGQFRSDVLIANACGITHLRRDGAFMDTPGSDLAFMSRGDRMTYASRPMGYLVSLPTASLTSKLAVEEYLRQYGPGGYNYIVQYNP